MIITINSSFTCFYEKYKSSYIKCSPSSNLITSFIISWTLPSTDWAYICLFLIYFCLNINTGDSFLFVSILMFVKIAVLTFRSFLNIVLSIAIVLSFCVCFGTYHFRLNIWLFSIITFFLIFSQFYPLLSLKPLIFFWVGHRTQ